jgi:hypothetical protein
MIFFENLKIDFQRLVFRRKLKKDARIMGETILKADKISEKTRKRLWVFKIDVADYRIYTKAEIKGAIRSMHLTRMINMYQPNEYIIHITKKPE